MSKRLKLGPAIVSWRDVSTAVSIYEAAGFQYVEAPWIVSTEAVEVTLPPDREGLNCPDGALVGSAEQAFIELMIRGQIVPGKYVAAGPCFRDDPVDELHHRTFFKVELIELQRTKFSSPAAKVQEMAETALDLFQRLGAEQAKIIKTSEGLDITLRGIELGSYGKRSYKGWHWVYGTGLAEPRFSMVIAGE